MSLLGDIQARLRKQAVPTAGGPTGVQAATLSTIQAGSGKARTGGTPRASNLGEQAAGAANAAAGAQQAAQIGMAAERVGEQAAGLDQQANLADASLASAARMGAAARAGGAAEGAAARTTTAAMTKAALDAQARQTEAGLGSKFGQAQSDLAAQADLQREDIFQQFAEGTADLAYRKDAAQLEATAQRMALNDKRYTDELLRIGQMQRLDNDLSWKTELNSLVMGERLNDMLSGAAFKVDLNADQRSWNEQMGAMDSDFAMSILAADASSANARMLVKGGIDAAGAYQAGDYDQYDPAKKPKTAATTDGGLG